MKSRIGYLRMYQSLFQDDLLRCPRKKIANVKKTCVGKPGWIRPSRL